MALLVVLRFGKRRTSGIIAGGGAEDNKGIFHPLHPLYCSVSADGYGWILNLSRQKKKRKVHP
jgi:hypothetical protein